MKLEDIQNAIEDWAVIFKLETGVEAPHTLLYEGLLIEGSEWRNDILLGYKDSSKHPLWIPFIWFHEAYHHLQYAIEGIEDDLARRSFNTSDAYYNLPCELAANRFAYKVCKAYGIAFELPSYLPKGYEMELS